MSTEAAKALAPGLKRALELINSRLEFSKEQEAFTPLAVAAKMGAVTALLRLKGLVMDEMIG